LFHRPQDEDKQKEKRNDKEHRFFGAETKYFFFREWLFVYNEIMSLFLSELSKVFCGLGADVDKLFLFFERFVFWRFHKEHY
jgi:hypothetical protein